MLESWNFEPHWAIAQNHFQYLLRGETRNKTLHMIQLIASVEIDEQNIIESYDYEQNRKERTC